MYRLFSLFLAGLWPDGNPGLTVATVVYRNSKMGGKLSQEIHQAQRSSTLCVGLDFVALLVLVQVQSGEVATMRAERVCRIRLWRLWIDDAWS
jgi:hypothetical protein